MRHTFASLLRQHVADMSDLKDLLGHKDIASTMIYAHQDMAGLKKAVDLFPNLKRNE